MDLKETLHSHFSLFADEGIDYFNRWISYFSSNDDKVTERIETALWIFNAIFIFLMIGHYIHPFYATIRLPIWINVDVINENPALRSRAIPEYGMHYTTLFIYFQALIFCIRYLRKNGMPPLQNLMITASLGLSSLIIPFEWAYIPLYDYFHNVIISGKWDFMFYGLDVVKMSPIKFLFMRTVLGRNTIMSLLPFVLVWISIDSIRNGKWRMKTLNKWSLTLFTIFIASYLAWIFLPLYHITPIIKGKWFPQTIYVWIGKAYLPHLGTVANTIVREEWHPDLWIKFWNNTVKALSVAWFYYTFIPRRIENGNARPI